MYGKAIGLFGALFLGGLMTISTLVTGTQDEQAPLSSKIKLGQSAVL